MDQVELDKCKNDMIYFAEKYLGLELTKWQKLYLKCWQNEKFVFIFGGRQARRLMTEDIIKKHSGIFK